MKSFRVALAPLFFLALSSVTDAANMSPSFEKSLEERLAARDAAIDAYPALRYDTYLPETVRLWRVLDLDLLKETIRVFKGSVEIQLPYQKKQDPANGDKIDKFTKDCNDFIAFFEAGVKSGDISETTAPPPATTRPFTTRPATPPPTTATTTFTTRPTTSPPRTTTYGSGSEDDEDSVSSPYTYTPYTWTPSTWTPTPYYPSYSTPSPYVYYYSGSSSYHFAAWKIGLIVFSVIVAVIRFIYWMSKRQAKEDAKKQEEEAAAAAAAAQVEGGEASQAAYVIITPADAQHHPAGVPAKM